MLFNNGAPARKFKTYEVDVIMRSWCRKRLQGGRVR